MKCDLCGRDVGRKEFIDIRSDDSASDSSGTKTVLDAGTKTTKITMCASCAASRKKTERTFAWAIVVLLAGMIVASVLAALL
jgi:hypothetical protein